MWFKFDEAEDDRQPEVGVEEERSPCSISSSSDALSSSSSSPKRLHIESISFACGGWLQFYLFGVARAMQKMGVQVDKYCGCSAGALTAAGMAFDGDFDRTIELCKAKVIKTAYADLWGLFRLSDYVTMALEAFCNLEKWAELGNSEKLQIAITQLPFFNKVRVAHFTSRDDLKKALLASASAFPFASLTWWRGSLCIDGGLTDFQPVVDQNTLRVSPFYFNNADIVPSRYVPLWWGLVPPGNADTIDWLYALGQEDASKYISDKMGAEAFEEFTQHSPTKGVIEHRRRRHRYDIPRCISFNRFLGYDRGTWVLPDFVLKIILCAVKPLLGSFIYCELLLSSAYSLTLSFVLELVPLLPLAVIALGMLGLGNLTFTFIVMVLLWLFHAALHGPLCVRTVSHFVDLCDAIKCILSLSLLLRFMSFAGALSKTAPNKEKLLFRLSLCYRVCRFIL